MGAGRKKKPKQDTSCVMLEREAGEPLKRGVWRC